MGPASNQAQIWGGKHPKPFEQMPPEGPAADTGEQGGHWQAMHTLGGTAAHVAQMVGGTDGGRHRWGRHRMGGAGAGTTEGPSALVLKYALERCGGCGGRACAAARARACWHCVCGVGRGRWRWQEVVGGPERRTTLLFGVGGLSCWLGARNSIRRRQEVAGSQKRVPCSARARVHARRRARTRTRARGSGAGHARPLCCARGVL